MPRPKGQRILLENIFSVVNLQLKGTVLCTIFHSLEGGLQIVFYSLFNWMHAVDLVAVAF